MSFAFSLQIRLITPTLADRLCQDLRHPAQRMTLSALLNGATDLAENLNLPSQGPLIK